MDVGSPVLGGLSFLAAGALAATTPPLGVGREAVVDGGESGEAADAA